MAIRDTLESYLAAMLVVIDRGILTDDIVIADIDRVMDLFVDARNALSKAELISLQSGPDGAASCALLGRA